MALKIGIIGLPNVGKSTTFNALTQAQYAVVANYPFCTIEPNKAVVPVPDPRLDKLAEIAGSKKIIHATVDFVDIAGLVKGASQGEGLGNKFLTNIRETDAILQVVRCFDDDNVVHVDGSINPVRDVEIIEAELILADFQMMENRLGRVQKAARADKAIAATLPAFEQLLAHLGAGKMAHDFEGRESEAGEQGVFLAVTDYVKALPNGIAPWIPGEYTVLGTDGYGLSEAREALREHFEISPQHIVIAALQTLAKAGQSGSQSVRRAIEEFTSAVPPRPTSDIKHGTG